MRISTKGRYALRVMIDLAQHGKDEYVKLQELAESQQISEKYLEGILGSLVRGKLLAGSIARLRNAAYGKFSQFWRPPSHQSLALTTPRTTANAPTSASRSPFGKSSILLSRITWTASRWTSSCATAAKPEAKFLAENPGIAVYSV